MGFLLELTDAITKDDVGAVRRLLDGNDLEIRLLHFGTIGDDKFINLLNYGDGTTSLGAFLNKAIQVNNEKRTKFLLDRDLNKQRYGFGRTYGYYNTYQRPVTDVIKLLIDKGADINLQDKYRNNNAPLHVAVRGHNIEVVKFLIKKGADPYIKNKDENTPLDVAVKDSMVEVAKLLIQNMLAKPFLEDRDIEKPSILNTNEELSNYWDSNYRSLNEKLFAAISLGNVDYVKKALKKGADVNAFNDDGYTPLMLAIIKAGTCDIKNYKQIVRLLIHHKDIDINAQSKERLTEDERCAYEERVRYKALEQANKEAPIEWISDRFTYGGHFNSSKNERAFERIMSLQLPTPIYKLDTARDLLRKHNVHYVGVFERILSTHPLSNLDGSFLEAGKGRDLLSAISRRDVKEAKRLLDLGGGVDINCFDENGDTLLHLIVKNRLISLLTPLLKLVSLFDLIDDVQFMVDCKNYEGKTWLNCCDPEVKAEIEQILMNYLSDAIYNEDCEIIEHIVGIFNVDVNQSRNGISLFDRAKYLGNDYICRYLAIKGGQSAGLNDEDKEIIDLECNLFLRKADLKDVEEEVLDLKQQKQRKETKIIELARSLQNKEKDILTLTNNLGSVKKSSQKLREFYESIQKGALNIEKQLKDKQHNITRVRYCARLSAAGTLAFILTFPYLMYFETFSVALSLVSVVCCLVSFVWFVYLKINMSKIFDKDSINLSEITLSESKVHPLIQSNASVHIPNDTIKELNSNCDLVTTDLSEEIEDRKGYIVNLRNKLENVKQDIENKNKLVEPLKLVVHNTKEEISKLKEQIQVKEKKICNLTQRIQNVNQAISKCREFCSDVHKNASETKKELKIQIDNKVNEYVHYASLWTLPGAIGSISASLIPLLPPEVTLGVLSPSIVLLGLSMCIYMVCCFASVPGAYFLISEMPSKEPNIELPKSCIELESFFNSEEKNLRSCTHI